VAQVTTGVIIHFVFQIHCISILSLLSSSSSFMCVIFCFRSELSHKKVTFNFRLRVLRLQTRGQV
jgi:hypothetical protein